LQPPEEPVFNEPWEAQAFAMVVKLHERGMFTWNEWAETLSTEIKSVERPYYEHWLAALEKIVEAKGLMSNHERLERVEAWDRAAHATPHGQPIELNRSSPAKGTVQSTSKTSFAWSLSKTSNP
jgi:nitrile hydratase accessory protein